MLEQQSFGDWLRRKRKALDLTRDGLADQVGCSAATIRKIEAEERRPSAQIVERLASIFSIPQNEQPAFLRFARGDWQSVPAELRDKFPWHVSTPSVPLHLPARTTSLIGRNQELAEVREYLRRADIRLVTLVGPPGIGKTRLSIEAARGLLNDFPDGIFFVGLGPLDDSRLIAITIAQALGYVGARSISMSEQLKEGIGEKQVLIVLDNCEHLIEGVASLVAFLLSACPRLKILATSRESLRISGEWLYPVPAFEVPGEISSLDMETLSRFPALILFAERARAVLPAFVLNQGNVKTISAICAHLDGLPLAIELIAARIRLMPPQALLDQLSGQFILTADGRRAASERQKTLNNAIAWSFNLLPPEEQKLFAYLSVFSGSFAPDEVEAAFSRKVTERPLPTLIASLLDKSLLKPAPGLESSGEARYTMLVTIQEYARERLREMGQETEIRNDHLAYFLDLAKKADKELRGENQLAWLHRLEVGRDNLRAALDWAIEAKQTETALQIVRDLHWFWFVYGDHNEGRQWFERVLGMPDATIYPEAQAHALTQLAHHIFLVGHRLEPQIQEVPFMRQLAEQALSIARVHGDKHNMARALVMLGLDLVEEKAFTAARSAFEESQILYQESSDEWGYAHAVMCLGYELNGQDQLEPAFSLYQQALVVFRRLGDRYFICVTVRGIAIVEMKRQNLASAVSALQEALIAAQQLKSKYEIAATLSSWGEVEKRLGNPARAVCLYWAAKNIYDSIGAWQAKDDDEFENDLGSCRVALEESAFAAAMDEGRALTMEQAIAYALE